MRGKRFIGKPIELAGLGIPVDRRIELLRVEFFEPRAKPRKLAGGKLFDGLFDVLGGGHALYIAFFSGSQNGAWLAGRNSEAIELANSFSAANAGPPTSPPEARQMPGTI